MLDLLAEAAAWTAARGHPNWPARFSERLIASAVATGELFVAEAAGEAVATLTLQSSDPRFWGEAALNTDAGYLHRLAVRRVHAGRGLGYRLLDWCDGYLRAHGRACLRLDVVTDNAPLRRYYEAVGFVHCREVEGELVLADGTRRPWRTSLYERPCASPPAAP